MDLRDYPADWRAISLEVRARSGGRCECAGECGRRHPGRCAAANGQAGSRHRTTDQWRPWDDIERGVERFGELDEDYGRPVRVVLTVAHLHQGPCADHHAAGVKCGDPAHLKAFCQACHLHYDLAHHTARRKQNRFSKKAVGDLFA